MRLKIAVKESFKKKQEMKNWQRKEMPKEARKTEIAMGDCIKWSRKCVMGEEWGKRATDRRNWRLLTENAVRGRSKTMETEIMINSPLTTVMPRKEEQQNDLSLVTELVLF